MAQLLKVEEVIERRATLGQPYVKRGSSHNKECCGAWFPQWPNTGLACSSPPPPASGPGWTAGVDPAQRRTHAAQCEQKCVESHLDLTLILDT